MTVECAVPTAPAPIRFTIADNGIGIAPEQLATLFTPFVQGETVFRKRHRGAGLGLAIVKRLVELMHGSLQIDSRPGNGTTLTIELPLAAAAQAPRPLAAAPPAEPHRVIPCPPTLGAVPDEPPRSDT